MYASIGAIGFGVSQLLFVYIVVRNVTGSGVTATAQVWEKPKGLEWTVPSPAPYHTFAKPPEVGEDKAFS